MRLKDIKPGDKVVFASRNVFRTGNPNEGFFVPTAEVAAVGRYTQTYGPCGQPQYAGPLAAGENKVVLKLKNDQLPRGRRSNKQDHGYLVVRSAEVMSAEEWKLRNAPYIEQQQVIAKWVEDLKAAEKVLSEKLTAAIEAAMVKAPAKMAAAIQFNVRGYHDYSRRGQETAAGPMVKVDISTWYGSRDRKTIFAVALENCPAKAKKEYETAKAAYAELFAKDPRRCDL